MAFFQNSVLNKHLKGQDAKTVKTAYQKFTTYFHNPAIQQNIRVAKEEQFQEGFLRELFVKILDYTLNPQPDYNLTTELKNEKGSKKADGAILKDGKALGVIELKGTNTKDLDKINEQAFNYKNNQTGCVYVVTSNFEKLRFFVHNAVEHIEFNLFTLSLDEFKILWLCLNADNLLSGVPLKVKEESLLAEENITKQLYKDYSAFKTDMWRNMAGNHPQDDQLMLYRKTQKLLDRFLFIFFAEDSGLLPPNSISKIIEKWKQDTDWGEDRKLYDIYKQYFGFINSGRKARGDRAEIFAYNGGLFQEDLILDNIKIDDEILLKHTEKLTAYDFQSEVDVNILGHIFENSLNEIDNITAELEGKEIDKSKTKRKKDGVFYTPKYITKYIVDNTIGKLCEEKKAKLNITDERFGQTGKRSRKGIADLQAYRDWLLDLKICDPACGSGAFLNQALDFLMEEHRYIDELTAQYHKAPLILSDIETQILEQNIYGVDINEESVEIAKLSLWLRTAQRGRKLTTLNHNIKCGNSLIDDPEVAGEKAFSWPKEFPKVFEKGGFDVVIGNPPYVKLETIKEVSQSLEKLNYKTFDKRGDLYVLFVEKGFSILKENGTISYIIPNKWLQAGYGQKLREFFLNKQLYRLIDFGDIQIFEGATTYPVIFVARQNKPNENFLASLLKESGVLDFEWNVENTAEVFKSNDFNGDTWVISSGENQQLLNKLSSKFKTLKELINGEALRGILSGLSEAFIIDEDTKAQIIDDVNSRTLVKQFLQGRDIKRYVSGNSSNYMIIIEKGFTKSKIGDVSEEEAWNWFEKNYTGISKWLVQFEEKAKKRTDKGDYWWELRACDYYSDFAKPKIMYQKFQVKPCFIYNEQGLYCNDSMWIIPSGNKALLGVFNSKMGWWLITKYCTQIQNGCQLIWKYFGQIPIPEITNSAELTALVNKMIAITAEQQKLANTLASLLQSKFEFEKLTTKLQNWHKLEFKDFLKELKKAKVKLSLSEEAEWLQYFNEQKQKAQELKSEINQVDKEIDQMVYEIYGLTEEEIAIVENSTK
jgi:type I restriction-modification system DNA methylase subunit